MFKLPALKPYGGEEGREARSRLAPTLTASDEFSGSPSRKGSLRGRGDGSRSSPAQLKFEPDESFNPPVKTRNWDAQASEVMADASTTERFRSLAVYADIKLQEALDKCNDITPAHARTEGAPDRFRAACCLQLLNELCAFVGPFEHTLRRIKEELALSIYSEYYSSEGGNLAFDQIPWFVVAERLEAEKKQLLADRERFTAALMEHQSAMVKVEGHLAMLQEKVAESEEANATLRAEVEALQERERDMQMESTGAKEELKRARKDLLRLRDDHRRLEADSTSAREEAEDQENALRLRMQHMKRQVADAEARVQEVEAQKAKLVPATTLMTAEKRIAELTEDVEKYKERADELRLERIKEVMTPRVNWKVLDPFGEGEPPPGTSSKDMIKRMVRRLRREDADAGPSKKEAEALTEAMAQLSDAQTTAENALALLTPEPPMIALNWQGIDRALEDPAAPPVISITAFGLGAEIPRFLRYEGRMSFPEMPVAEAEAQVAALWAAKRDNDAATGRLHHVGDFMFHWARRVAGEPDMDRIAHAAYRLLVSCTNHAATSPQIALFLEVLAGRVGEAAVMDMHGCVAGVAKLLRMLAGLGRGRGTFELTEEATDLVLREDLEAAIENFFPTKQPDKVKQLLEAADKDCQHTAEDGDDRMKVAQLLDAGGSGSHFLRALQLQYIQEVSAYCSQVQAAVKTLTPKGMGPPGEDRAQHQVEMGPGGLQGALATVDRFSPGDVSNLLAAGAGLAFGDLADAVATGGGRVDSAVFLARLRGMLVRPAKLWDGEGALAWCTELRDGKADRGASSAGAQPDLA